MGVHVLNLADRDCMPEPNLKTVTTIISLVIFLTSLSQGLLNRRNRLLYGSHTTFSKCTPGTIGKLSVEPSPQAIYERFSPKESSASHRKVCHCKFWTGWSYSLVIEGLTMLLLHINSDVHRRPCLDTSPETKHWEPRYSCNQRKSTGWKNWTSVTIESVQAYVSLKGQWITQDCQLSD